MATTTTRESRGVIAYSAYGKSVGFRAVNGEEMPMFADLPADRQEAWIVSANTIWDLATTGRTTI